MSILSLHNANIPEHVKLPPELVVGIGVVDEQHRLLLAQLDYLTCKAEGQTLDSEIMGECAYVIGQTLLMHFRTEEEIMWRNKTPADQLARHIDDHGRIISEYVALQELIMTKPDTKIHDVLGMIEDWIVTHIADFDVPALRINNLAASGF